MANKYFVLYKRDRYAEGGAKAKGRRVYDGHKEFGSRKKATAFAFSHLQDTPIMAKAVKTLTDCKSGGNYVVAAYFPYKYSGYSLGEEFSVPTHEVVRCSQESLDAVVEELASEDPSKIYLGIEKKIR